MKLKLEPFYEVFQAVAYPKYIDSNHAKDEDGQTVNKEDTPNGLERRIQSVHNELWRGRREGGREGEKQ